MDKFLQPLVLCGNYDCQSDCNHGGDKSDKCKHRHHSKRHRQHQTDIEQLSNQNQVRSVTY